MAKKKNNVDSGKRVYEVSRKESVKELVNIQQNFFNFRDKFNLVMIDISEAIDDIEEGHNRKKCADVLERAYDQLGDLVNKCSDDREDFYCAIDNLTAVHRK
jgi:hypothetical protein